MEDRQRPLSRPEKAKLETFFAFCCFDHSFVDLGRLTRQNLKAGLGRADIADKLTAAARALLVERSD